MYRKLAKDKSHVWIVHNWGSIIRVRFPYHLPGPFVPVKVEFDIVRLLTAWTEAKAQLRRNNNLEPM